MIFGSHHTGKACIKQHLLFCCSADPKPRHWRPGVSIRFTTCPSQTGLELLPLNGNCEVMDNLLWLLWNSSKSMGYPISYSMWLAWYKKKHSLRLTCFEKKVRRVKPESSDISAMSSSVSTSVSFFWIPGCMNNSRSNHNMKCQGKQKW